MHNILYMCWNGDTIIPCTSMKIAAHIYLYKLSDCSIINSISRKDRVHCLDAIKMQSETVHGFIKSTIWLIILDIYVFLVMLHTVGDIGCEWMGGGPGYCVPLSTVTDINF